MISESITSQPERAFVWFWLPGETAPVLAGRVDQAGPSLTFIYSSDYLASDGAIPLFTELPLRSGVQTPRRDIHGCIADAGPDSWGQRVIANRLLASGVREATELTHLTYLASAGPDRIGALDFQVEEGPYIGSAPGNASLGELLDFAEKVEAGEPLPRSLEEGVLRGSSIGGARPKALLDDGDRKLIAKFGSSTDLYPVVQCEYVATRLAKLCGLDASEVELRQVMDKQVLVIERFDRGGGRRRAMVSALTILGLSEEEARYASYADLAHLIRRDFRDPRKTLRELFSRITFNILVSNLDDHARNQSAFWDGRDLELTPFYDVSPSPRTVGETKQVMAIGDDGWRFSQLAGCVERAATYQLRRTEAEEIVDHQVETIKAGWEQVCDEASLTRVQRSGLMGKQFLNPFAFETARS